LDLNFNHLFLIENNIFAGLSNLNDLSILSQNELRIFNESFKHVSSLSTLLLNESLIFRYQCLFMHIQNREVQRAISNKYVFYKSINLLTIGFGFNESLKMKCDLVFSFFQFNVHLNLKTDESFEFFFSSCQYVLIKSENSFIQTQNHLKMCDFDHVSNEEKESQTSILISINIIQEIFSNFYYLFTMALLMSLFCPLLYMILRHVLCFQQEHDKIIE